MLSKSNTRSYRIDFGLIVLTGNLTRYKILRPMVEQDPTVIPRWVPIRTWVDGDWLRFLPTSIRIRARHFLDARVLFFSKPGDAIVIHAFETYNQYVIFQRLLRRKVVIVHNHDGPLPADGRNKFVVDQTDLFVSFSQHAKRRIQGQRPEIPDSKVVVLNPGINLSKWPQRPPKQPGEKFKLLFVGGDFLRKGGDTLLDAFEQGLQEHCTLDMVTDAAQISPAIQQQIARMPGVTVHSGVQPESDTLRTLYQTCDCFVMPTNRDASPWVAIEALATGMPVITCDIGGVTEIVRPEETGIIVPAKDPSAIVAAVHRLRESPELRQTFIVQGRKHIEEHFDAEKNTKRLLDLIKERVDRLDPKDH